MLGGGPPPPPPGSVPGAGVRRCMERPGPGTFIMCFAVFCPMNAVKLVMVRENCRVASRY